MDSRRKLQWDEAEVKCPFYISHEQTRRSITCEGYTEGTDMVSRFRTQGRQNRHMGLYCAGNYAQCPVYRCTYAERYADD